MNIDLKDIKSVTTDEDEISLKDLLIKIRDSYLFLKVKWRQILIASISCSLIGMFLALSSTTMYKAVTTFAMEEDKGSSTGGLNGALGIASSFGIDLGGAGGGGTFASSNLPELMKSRLIVEKVLLKQIIINNRTTNLANFYLNIHGSKLGFKKNKDFENNFFPLDIKRNQFTIKQDSVLYVIYKDLVDNKLLNVVQKDKKVSITTIEVKSESEIFAKLFCENLASATSEFYIQTKSRRAKINVDVLQKQVDSVKFNLDKSILGVATEVDNVYNLNPALNIKGASSKKKQIDVQANTAILTNLVVQLELAKITLRKETPLIQLIDTPILPLEKSKSSVILSIILGGFIGMMIIILYFLISKFIINTFK